jgi:hypothetical protein
MAKKTTPKKRTTSKKKGGAPKDNQFWKARSSHGRKPIFEKPEDMWNACCEYFEWVERHPLTAAELVKYQGKAKVTKVPKMRAMTISGLCIFLDISQETWFQYRKKEGFSEVCTRVENIIRTQKFEGAAADLLNPAIIARDLGLADRREHSGPAGKPLIAEDMSKNEIARRIAFVLYQGIKAQKRMEVDKTP